MSLVTPDESKRYTPKFTISNLQRIDVPAGTIAMVDISIDDDLIRINRVRLIQPTIGVRFLGWPSWRTTVAGRVHYNRMADVGWPLAEEIFDAVEAEYERVDPELAS